MHQPRRAAPRRRSRSPVASRRVGPPAPRLSANDAAFATGDIPRLRDAFGTVQRTWESRHSQHTAHGTRHITNTLQARAKAKSKGIYHSRTRITFPRLICYIDSKCYVVTLLHYKLFSTLPATAGYSNSRWINTGRCIRPLAAMCRLELGTAVLCILNGIF